MTSSIPTRRLLMPKTICDTFEERSVDLDVVLPDYIPEVAAVLKCTMRPYVTSRSNSGDRYTVDGVAAVRVLYLAEDRKDVYCYEASQPFHVGFACDNALQHIVELKVDYVNCRAIAPRRMDIHGAFRVFLTAFGTEELSVCCKADERDVFCRTQTLTCTLPVSQANKSFVLEERYDLGAQADRLLFTDATVMNVETKPLVNKMIVKGCLRVKSTYMKGEDMHSVMFDTPFSQILDLEGLNERGVCRVFVHVGDCDAHLQASENGACQLILSARLMVVAHGDEIRDEDVVLDAYSVTQPLLCEMTPMRYLHERTCCTEQNVVHTQSELPETVATVLDTWAELKSSALSDDKRQLLICVVVGMLTKDSDGQIGYYERTLDLECPISLMGGDVTARLLSLQSNVSGRSIYLQLDVEYSICRAAENVQSVVCGAVVDRTAPYPKSDVSMRIVYAKPGDSVWDIAKTNRACMQDIMAENELEDMVIAAPTMLMIPVM